MNIAQYIEEYESECTLALEKLADKMQPYVNECCNKWGFEFYNGMGDWNFAIPRSKIIDPIGGGNLNDLFRFIEPDLDKVLDSEVDRNSTLGECLESYLPQTEHQFVILEAVEVFETTSTIEEINIFEGGVVNEENLYYNPISLPLANKIIEVFSQDKELGGEMISSVPRVRHKLLKQI